MTAKCCEETRNQEQIRLPVYRPAADIVEREDSFVISLDMPGVDDKRVEVTLDRNVLTVKGSRDLENEAGFETLIHGYRPGNYERAFRLGDGLDETRIKAVVKNGVVRVTVAKAPHVVPKKIQVVSEE